MGASFRKKKVVRRIDIFHLLLECPIINSQIIMIDDCYIVNIYPGLSY